MVSSDYQARHKHCNQVALAANDINLGSSAPLLLPGTHLLIGGGKDSKLFLMKRDNKVHFDASAVNG